MNVYSSLDARDDEITATRYPPQAVRASASDL